MMEITPEGTAQRSEAAESEAAVDTTVAVQPTNGKRKAETELSREPSDRAGSAASEGDAPDPPISKNQLKRLRKQQQYQVYKEERKIKRKDKRHAKQERKRVEREAKIAAAEAAGIDPQTVLRPPQQPKPQQVPISFILDCDFERYMRESEIISLSSQVVRSYSMNRKARYHGHLFISSWGGQMRTRFETVYKNAHNSWKGVRIVEGDFPEAAKVAKELMASKEGGDVTDILKPRGEQPALTYGDRREPIPAGVEPEDIDRSIVYLSAESPYSLERLEPNTCYVIGGLVDRNREKGLCYKRAQEYKVRTAKLPIGEYMAMQSRFVLTTNQVVEIMVKWLECGDWGKAFLGVIPKRKGGTLRTDVSQADADDIGGDDALESDTMVVDEATNGTEDADGTELEPLAVTQET